jgi:predicted methyltransferase
VRRTGLNDGDERLIKFDRFAIFDEDGLDDAGVIGFDLVHHLHRFHDADDVTDFDMLTDFDKRR